MIIFILAEVSKKIIGEVTDAAINWAKQRLIDENSSRPKFISIFGPEGVPINAKLITPGNVEDKTDQSSARFQKFPDTRCGDEP